MRSAETTITPASPRPSRVGSSLTARFAGIPQAHRVHLTTKPGFDQDFWEQLCRRRCASTPISSRAVRQTRIGWPGLAGSVADMVGRMENGVAPGGTLFLVGHRPIEPSAGAATAAASQVQLSVEDAVAALDSSVWELVVAEERPRAVAGTGVDAVIRARRRA